MLRSSQTSGNHKINVSFNKYVLSKQLVILATTDFHLAIETHASLKRNTKSQYWLAHDLFCRVFVKHHLNQQFLLCKPPVLLKSIPCLRMDDNSCLVYITFPIYLSNRWNFDMVSRPDRNNSQISFESQPNVWKGEGHIG